MFSFRCHYTPTQIDRIRQSRERAPVLNTILDVLQNDLGLDFTLPAFYEVSHIKYQRDPMGIPTPSVKDWVCVCKELGELHVQFLIRLVERIKS